MEIYFVVKTSECVTIDEERISSENAQRILKDLKEGKIKTVYDLYALDYLDPDDLSWEGSLETQQLTPGENGGNATIEAYNDDKEVIFKNN